MKNTYRFFVEQDLTPPDLINIDDSDLVRQWQSVLRFRPGQHMVLLDGRGSIVVAELVQLDKKSAQVRLLEALEVSNEPAIQVTLCVGLIRLERFEWMLQKGTELGAVAFVPLITERSTRDSISSNKFQRWERIIREAAEQSERTLLPRLYQPMDLQASLELCPTGILLAEAGIAQAAQAVLPHLPATYAIWCGPEGGWADQEIHTAQAAGLTTVRLGPRILRAETAPIAALSVAMFVAHEWHA